MTITAADASFREGTAPEGALRLYRELLRIRRFEEELHRLVSAGRVGGTTHLCVGQEAVPVGVSSILSPEDQVVSTHRGHGHLLAKGARADRALAEIAGRRDGYCGGKGGSQHVAVPAIGHMGSNGITGGGLPIAAGLAFASRFAGSDACVVSYLGDGACGTGNFHETLNLAALWELPVVFVLENNLYAMSTPVARATACDALTAWAERYKGLEARAVDGNDVIAVAAAAKPLVERARAGGGPALLECRTYRMAGHSKSDPCVYRTREEEERWRERDPLKVLVERAALAEPDLAAAREAVEEEIRSAVAFALASPPGDRELALEHLAVLRVPADPAPCRIAAGAETNLTEAIRETLRGEMERDGNVVLIGEDIGAYGGAFGVTRGLQEEFGTHRVLETPIAENGFTGLAVGAAVGGLRPVVELMFGDFVTCCMDALVNHAAKLAYMYAGQVSVPLTLRMPIGRRNGYGATHSQSLEAWFLHVPGLRVVCPSTVPDAVGLLRTAVRSDGPVIFLEPKLLYPSRGPMPGPDHLVDFGRARVDRVGGDVTLFTYGQALGICRDAAERLASRGFEAEIVDLRSLSPFDLETCVASVRKTGRGICVHEATETAGVGDALAARLQRDAFGHLRAPILTVGARHCPVPSSPELEDAVMPSSAEIVRAALPLLTDY